MSRRNEVLTLLAILACAPMFFTQSSAETCLYSILVAVNTIWRIAFPVQYVPASQTRPGFFFGPIWARCLATVAELSFYYILSVLMQLPVLFYLAIAGEVVCWLHIYFQSELGGFIEDSTWALIMAIAAVFGAHFWTQLLICLPFVLHMVFYHLPRMSKRLKPPHIRRYEGSAIVEPDDDTMVWVVSSLLAQPLGFAWFLYFL